MDNLYNTLNALLSDNPYEELLKLEEESNEENKE